MWHVPGPGAGELVGRTPLGQGSTGAANDLIKATELAIKIGSDSVLSSAIGLVRYPVGDSTVLWECASAYLSRPFAKLTQAAIASSGADAPRGGATGR
jgi:hypothetical protein